MLFNYRLFARHIIASLFPRGVPTLRLGPRRIRFLAVFAVAFPAMWLSSVIGLCLDNLFYRGWKRCRGAFPVFIVGNFRTGSSFLYRMLSRDESTFLSMKTWELYFAPSVLQRQFWRGFWTVDRFCGAPLMRRIRAAQERVLGQVRLHRIRLHEPEEDEALFYLTWHTLFTCFFFPMADPGFAYHRFDTALPHATRRRLMAFYRGCIQRHLFAHRSSAHYLAKNPSATAKIASLLEEYPDARFLYLFRDPVETVPSTMRWLSFTWHYFSSARERYPLRELVQEITMAWFRYPLEAASRGAADRILFLSYDDLVEDPEATVRRIYGWLGFSLSPAFAVTVGEEAEAAREHRPDGTGDLGDTGLTQEAIRASYREAAEACDRALRASRRPTPAGASRRATSRGSSSRRAPPPRSPGTRRSR